MNIDKNFRMVEMTDETGNKKIVTLLRARFDRKCLADGKYIAKHELDKTTFSKLLNRRVTGAKVKDPESKTGKIISQLKKDGIWLGELPWEVKEDESQRVS